MNHQSHHPIQGTYECGYRDVNILSNASLMLEDYRHLDQFHGLRNSLHLQDSQLFHPEVYQSLPLAADYQL
jgi:hypothetical protein